MFVSPLSVSAALAMVYPGATGDTRAAMAAMLAYAGIEDAVLNPAWRDLIRSLEHVDDDVILAITDAVWMDEAFAPAVKQAFPDAVVAQFDSEVHTADFLAEGRWTRSTGGSRTTRTGGSRTGSTRSRPPSRCSRASARTSSATGRSSS